MLEKGVVPNAQIYSKMIISNCERGCIKEALKLHYEMQGKGFLPTLEMYHSLIYRLSKERDTDGALRLYNEMEVKSMLPTASSCSVVLDLLCKEGRMKELCKLLRESLKKGIVADEVVIDEGNR
jgi:pentatricopeptide repeat protein